MNQQTRPKSEWERRAEAAEAALAASRRREQQLRELVTTVLVEREYQRLLKWREQYLDSERETGDHEFIEDHPLSAQLICFAITDAMKLREIDAALALSGESQEK